MTAQFTFQQMYRILPCQGNILSYLPEMSFFSMNACRNYYSEDICFSFEHNFIKRNLCSLSQHSPQSFERHLNPWMFWIFHVYTKSLLWSNCPFLNVFGRRWQMAKLQGRHMMASNLPLIDVQAKPILVPMREGLNRKRRKSAKTNWRSNTLLCVWGILSEADINEAIHNHFIGQ